MPGDTPNWENNGVLGIYYPSKIKMDEKVNHFTYLGTVEEMDVPKDL